VKLPQKLGRYLVLRDGINSRFPWVLIDASSGERAVKAEHKSRRRGATLSVGVATPDGK